MHFFTHVLSDALWLLPHSRPGTPDCTDGQQIGCGHRVGQAHGLFYPEYNSHSTSIENSIQHSIRELSSIDMKNVQIIERKQNTDLFRILCTSRGKTKMKKSRQRVGMLVG